MSLDLHMKLYHSNVSSDHLEICPDADGLGMIEIRAMPGHHRIVVRLEDVDDLVTALKMVRNHMQGLLQK